MKKLSALLCVALLAGYSGFAADTKPAAGTSTSKPAATTTTTTTKPAASTTTTKPAATTPAKPAAATPAKTAAKPAAKEVKPQFDSGRLLCTVGLGLGNYWYSYYYDEYYAGSLGLAGGIEYGIYRTALGGLPLTFGASMRVNADMALRFFIDNTLCGAAMATAHLGFRGPKVPASAAKLAPWDTYIGLGVGVTTGSDANYTIDTKLGPAFIFGETYYFDDKIGVTFEAGYLGAYQYHYPDTDTYTYSRYTQAATYGSFMAVFKL